MQSLQAGIGIGLGFGRNRIDRTLQIVGEIKHVAGKAGDAVGAGVGHFLGGALAQILHLRQRAQHLVARIRNFLLQQLDRTRFGIVRHHIGFGDHGLAGLCRIFIGPVGIGHG